MVIRSHDPISPCREHRPLPVSHLSLTDRALHRSGEIVGRDQVARLMRYQGIQGVRRGTTVRTTRPDDKAGRHPELVDRKFTADRPNALWVTDLTYVPTWSGVGRAGCGCIGKPFWPGTMRADEVRKSEEKGSPCG